MTSSLVGQLSGLRSLNASRLASSSALTTHASYLFPPRTAASQDLDTVFSLGETGYSELVLQDVAFEKWPAASTLFGPTAKSTDRTLLGATENAALTAIIEEFLEMISPVLLSKSAAKCLEWLVRRFRIHDFNSTAVLRVFLPYHQTPQFARMIHILDISSLPYLSFLQPLQKTTQPLPTSILLSAMLTPPSSSHALDLIRFVALSLSASSTNNKVPQRPQILFWSSTLVQLCARMGGATAGAQSSMGLTRSAAKKRTSTSIARAKQDDEQLILSIILPAAVNAATSPQFGVEAQTAGSLVLCAIGVTFHLSVAAVTSTVAELWQPSSSRPKLTNRQFQAFLVASAALITSISSEDSAGLISPATAIVLLGHRGLSSELASMSQSYDVQPFLAALFHAFAILAASGDEQAGAAAATTLKELLSLPEIKGGISSSFLQTFLTRVILAGPPSQATLGVLAACRQSRPDVWDAALRPSASLDAPTEDKRKVNDLLSQLTRLELASSGVAVTPHSSSVEWVKLNSAEPGQRTLALQSFVHSIEDSTSANNSSLVSEALLPRLADDDTAVLQTVYSSNGKFLLDAISSHDVILKQIETVTTSAQVSPAALHAHLLFLLGPYLCRHPKASNRVLRSILWSRLLTIKSNCKQAAVVRQVCKEVTPSGPLASLLRRFDQLQIQAMGPVSKANKAVVAALASWINETDSESHWNSHVSFLFSNIQLAPTSALLNHASKALSLLVVNELIRTAPTGSRFESVVSRLLQAVTSADLLRAGADYSMLANEFSDKAWQVIYERPSQMTDLLCWQGLLLTAQKLQLDSGSNLLLGMSPEDAKYNIGLARQLYEVANDVASDSGASRQLLAALFARLGENAGSFLAGLCSFTESEETLTATALKHLRAFLSAYASDKASRVRDFQTLLPMLLIVLGHNSASVRTAALDCQQLILEMAKEGSATASTDDVEVWGYDAIYGSASEPLKYLDCATAYQFCFELAKHSESIANDASFIESVLAGLLTPSKGQSKKELNFKRSVIAYLLSHIDALPSYKKKLHLLRTIAKVRDGTKLQPLMKLIAEVVSLSSSSSAADYAVQLNEEEKEEFVTLLFEAFDKRSKASLQDPNTGAWSLLIKALHSTKSSKSAAQAIARVYPVLTTDLRIEAVSAMINILGRPDVRAPAEIRQALHRIDLDATVLTMLFAQLRDRLSSPMTSGADGHIPKRNKTNGAEHSVDISASVLGELLEASLSHPLPPNGALILELFEDLRCVVELHSTKTFNGDYLLHLCMSNLNKLLEPAMPTSEIVQSVRVDTVVNVIKASSNPSTFQQALLLLSLVASIAPELVLHSAMPIFTFVGSTVLQRDDAFSFTVVERVLQSILPPLVRSLKARGNANQSSFALLRASRPFLCIFTDSATHVPRHRRQNFFQLLIEVLGPQDYAAAVAMLLVDRSAQKIARQASGEVSSNLQLPLAILGAQSGAVQLQALNEVWEEARRLWQAKDMDSAQMSEDVFLDRLGSVNGEHSERQVDVKTQVTALVAFIKAALTSSRGSAGMRLTSASFNPTYHTFVESALTMKQCDDAIISSLAQDTLQGVMVLIPISLFVNIVEQLVTEVDGRHVGSGFQLVASRVARVTEAEREVMAASSSKIIAALHEHLTLSSSINRSAALTALDVLSSSAHQQELPALGQILPLILSLAKDGVLSSGERQKTFSVLRNLTAVLGPRLIAYIKPSVELCLAAISSTSLPTSIVTRSFETLENLFKTATTFMDSHIKQVLGTICKSHLRNVFEERASPSPTGKSLSRLLFTMMKRMASEKVFSCIFELWEEVSQNGGTAEVLLAVLTLLSRDLSQTDRTGISSNYKAVFRFVLQVLDLRRTNKKMSLPDINAVEDATVRVFVRLVLKLNETTFRPLFLRIYDWAALDLLEENDGELPVSDPGLVARRIALYKINNALSDRLRDLVSHYYSTLLDLTIELLSAFRSREVQNAELWSAVVASIGKSAIYDEGTFWNPARLSKLTPVFIGQLAFRNPELLTNLGGHEIVTRALAPAVANLAKTVPDEASLKVINSALLTQLRIDEVPTRVAALEVATAMWSETSLAAVLLGLVPETVPHIAELMESDEGEIVEGTRAYIAAVEKVLGEPLDSYLQ